MNSRIFFSNILIRVVLIMATAFLFIWLTETLAVEFVFTLLAGILLILLQVYLLTRYVLGITRIMEQFIDAIGREETFEIQFGTGTALFQRLKQHSNSVKQAMNARRLEKEKGERILFHVINSADPALFCFNQRGEVMFVNDAARAFISGHEPHHLSEMKKTNRKLWEVLAELTPGSPRVVRLNQFIPPEGGFTREQLTSIRVKEVRIFDEYYKLFTLQNIQEELHKNESDSWQKIIRVLTHEIMNAVAPMLSLSKSLQKQVQADTVSDASRIREGLRMIETTGKGLIKFIEEYRRLSLLPPPKKEKLKLQDALDGIILLFDDEAKANQVSIHVEMEERELEVTADPHQFEMILLNLLRNSVESFTEYQRQRDLAVRAQRLGNKVLISVRDNGAGMAEELLDQVFVPFFSTKEGGSGIGLSLARQIMNNHEGSILLQSASGEGTVVTLEFA
jgi:two-component system, NtrC family, nitrogen regulation sensor histidine kinase NtrY